MNQREVQEKLLDSIDLMIEERFKILNTSNYYIEAVIESDNSDGTFDVEFNQQMLPSIKQRDGLLLEVGDIVLICVVNGDFSNKFIDLKRP